VPVSRVSNRLLRVRCNDVDVDRNYGCPVNGWKYEFGSKNLALAVGTLPEWLDENVHSVYCAHI
jgi:hypothetical protein